MDPQAHLSSITGTAVSNAEDSIYGFYQTQKPLIGLIRDGSGGWPVIPAHVELAKVDSQSGKGLQALNRLNSGIVKENLNTGRPILIDCCPILGMLSLNAIFACDRILVPVSADWLAVKGVLQVEKTLKALEHVFKKRLPRRFCDNPLRLAPAHVPRHLPGNQWSATVTSCARRGSRRT